jgi:hypothetical protein
MNLLGYFGYPQLIAEFCCHLQQNLGKDGLKSFLLKISCNCYLTINLETFFQCHSLEGLILRFKIGRNDEPKHV